MLSDNGIISAVERGMAQGGIDIHPFHEHFVQPASMDLTLHPLFRRSGKLTYVTVTDVPKDYMQPEEMCTPSGYIELKPGEFILATTCERIGLSAGYAARVEGRSSLGRLGLMTHVTAGFIDPGFNGQVTLELKNVSKWCLRLWPLMRIAQISFFKMDTMPTYSYDAVGHYGGQFGPTPARPGDIT